MKTFEQIRQKFAGKTAEPSKTSPPPERKKLTNADLKSISGGAIIKNANGGGSGTLNHNQAHL